MSAMNCGFVFSNQYRARFPCQRPAGHRGGHSLSRWREDSATPDARESLEARWKEIDAEIERLYAERKTVTDAIEALELKEQAA